MGGRYHYWTAEQIERARRKGEEMSAALKAGERGCLRGCLCALCGGDPAKQEPINPGGSDGNT